MPLNFNFEKKILKNMHFKKSYQNIQNKYNDIAENLQPEYRNMII